MGVEKMKKHFGLTTYVYPTREEMGRAAAKDIAEKIRELMKTQPVVRMIFAAAPSQNEVLSALASEDVDFSRIDAFHMDEYIGLPSDAPQGFGSFLRERIFDKVPFRSVHYLGGNAADVEAECVRYSALLDEAPIDIVCMGIGENGHIAFNDPPVADFNDPRRVKAVPLDPVCRMQQVHDGCFTNLDKVPEMALTLTVPALMSARHHFCIVPTKFKAEAVRTTICGEIATKCPATALRLAPDARLYLDEDSASLL